MTDDEEQDQLRFGINPSQADFEHLEIWRIW
jgi:hypothetical protein